MLPRNIAGRYAQALFDLAEQEGMTERWGQELASLGAVIKNMPDLQTLLTHPEIQLSRKEQLMNESFGQSASKPVLSMLFLLLKRGHDPDLVTIHEMYMDRWDRRRGVMPVTVTSAVPLDDRQSHALAAALATRIGSKIELSREVDPSLIAGLVVTMGDRVIDASARMTLEQLREAMRGA